MDNPFELLGLPLRFDLDSNDIERSYRELQRIVHPDRQARPAPGEQRAAIVSAVDVSEAYRTVRDDVLRAEALLRVLGRQIGPDTTTSQPGLLMEMMDLRESLQEARVAGDAARVDGLRARVVAERNTTLAELTLAFASSDLDRATALVGRLRYYRRFLEAVAGFEDEDTHMGPR